MALVDGNLGTAIYRAQKMVDDAFKEHEKHVTEIIVQNLYLTEDSVRLYEENAKLRELVKDMWEYVYVGTAQDGQSLHDRTQELGISLLKEQ